MEKRIGMHEKAKKEKCIANKKSILNAFLNQILKFNLAVAILFFLALIVNAGDVIVESGKLNVDNQLYVDGLGKVGIGTTIPSEFLHIYSKNNAVRPLTETDATGQVAGWAMRDSTNQEWRVQVNGNDASKFNIVDVTNNQDIVTIEKAAGNNLLYLDSTGRVGIGTANPFTPLHVLQSGNGLVNILDLKSSSQDGTSNWNQARIIRIGWDGGVATPNKYNSRIIGYYNPQQTTGSRLHFQTHTSSGDDDAFNTGILLDDAGRVGIGTASPGAPLSITGTGTTGADLEITTAASNIALGSRAKGPHGISFGDDVGSGVQLVYRTSPNQLILEKGDDFNDGTNIFSYDKDTDNFYFGGNVGIGIAGPKANLDVTGEIKVGNTGTACNVNLAGAIRYNSVSKIMEFCDGTSWKII